MSTSQDRAPAQRTTGRPPAREGASMGDLLRSLADDTSTLVRQEIRLAKLEAARTARRVAVNSGWIGAGAGVLALGTVCLVVALALGLGALLGSYWLGTLITGMLLVLVGSLMAWKGARALREGEYKPKETMASLEADARWAKSEADDMKKQLTSGSEQR